MSDGAAGVLEAVAPDGGEPPRAAVPAYEIPDFERDRSDLAAYEDAKKRYHRQELATARAVIERDGHARRDRLLAKIRKLLALRHRIQGTALQLTRHYLTRYPRRRTADGVAPPSIWEILFSFGGAWYAYKEALFAQTHWENLKATIQRHEAAVEALREEIEAAIDLKDEQLRAAFDTPEDLERFHGRPDVVAIHQRREAIEDERREFELRLNAGEVSPEELRDRAMAETTLTFATIPIESAVVLKVERYGDLRYLHLCDVHGNECLLSYDPRLDGLRSSVFEVFRAGDTYMATLSQNDDGGAVRLADHFKTRCATEAEAEKQYFEQRAAQRRETDQPATAPRDDDEGALVEVLARLAAEMTSGSNASAVPSATVDISRSR